MPGSQGGGRQRAAEEGSGQERGEGSGGGGAAGGGRAGRAGAAGSGGVRGGRAGRGEEGSGDTLFRRWGRSIGGPGWERSCCPRVE